jgi:hypothetical protein
MTLDLRSIDLLRDALRHLDGGFANLPRFDATPSPDELARIRAVLLEVAERMRDNFPYPHPLYAGQMIKPPHAVARLAYALAQHVNPEQPRARRRARELGDGEGGGRGARAHVRMSRRTSDT